MFNVYYTTNGSIYNSIFHSYVIAPYNEYPRLLGLLLKLLNGELVWSTRREVLKVLVITKTIIHAMGMYV